MTTKGLTPTQLARRQAVAAYRDRIRKHGRRIDLMLPPEAARALDQVARPGESATGTICRVLVESADQLPAAKRRA